MLRFSFLTGDVNFSDYGGKWISNKWNNGDFDVYFVIELVNWQDAVGEREAKEVGAKYNVNLSCVAPAAVSADEMASARRSCGWDDMPNTPAAIVEMLHSYGVRSPIEDWNGNNWRKLMAKAKERARLSSSFTFGFDMDKPKNAIGATGWDWLAGNPTAPIDRMRENAAQ